MNNKKRSFSMKTLKIGSYSIILTAVVIAVTVLLNVVVSALPTTYTHFNTESVDMYEISEESMKIINSIDEKINVYYVVEKGNEDTIIEELLSRYASLSSNIKVKNIDPAVDPTFVSNYTDDTSIEGSVVIFEGSSRSKIVKYDEIYYTEMTQEEQLAYYYYGIEGGTTYFLGEAAFTGAIDYVIRDELPTIYYLTGHNETTLGSSYLEMIDKENIAVEEINLMATAEDESERIRLDDCNALLIVSPTSDISDAEAETIKAYMDKGGDVILITDPDVFYAEDFPNLASVAEKAGLESIDGYVRDKIRGIQDEKYAFLPEVVSSEMRVTSKMESTDVNVIWWMSHGIKEIDSGTDAVITPILKTSTRGVVEQDDGKYYDDNSSGLTVYVGVQSDMSVTGEDILDEESSFIWYASPSVIYEDFTSAWNDEVFMATVGYLCDNTATLSIIGKTWDVEAMVMSDIVSNVWMIVFTAIIPLAIVGGGFAVWYRRRRR